MKEHKGRVSAVAAAKDAAATMFSEQVGCFIEICKTLKATDSTNVLEICPVHKKEIYLVDNARAIDYAVTVTAHKKRCS